MAGPTTLIDVLLRPADRSGVDNFFYVAAVPPVTPDALTYKREQLMRQGVLDNVTETCIGNVPLANRYLDPAGQEEMLTSITPVLTPAGCWAIIFSYPVESLLGSTMGQPYWQRVEVQRAVRIYRCMAVLTLVVFFGIRRSVLRFGRLARDMRRRGRRPLASPSRTRSPSSTAWPRSSTGWWRPCGPRRDSMRRRAEDNAHAFKTPIAIMRQSLEPLRRMSRPTRRAAGGRRR